MSHGFIKKTLGVLFADGSCNHFRMNMGGWGVVSCLNGEVMEIGAQASDTTNNRMEMMAVIAAMKLIEGNPQHCVILSDSQYTINGATKWVHAWKQRNWVAATGEPVKNKDLWIQILELQERLSPKCHVEFQWVRSHVGIHGNHRADKIAEQFCAGNEPDLYLGTLENYKLDLHDIRHKEDRELEYSRTATTMRNQAQKAGLMVKKSSPLDMIEAEAQAMIDRQMGRFRTISTI